MTTTTDSSDVNVLPYRRPQYIKAAAEFSRRIKNSRDEEIFSPENFGLIREMVRYAPKDQEHLCFAFLSEVHKLESAGAGAAEQEIRQIKFDRIEDELNLLCYEHGEDAAKLPEFTSLVVEAIYFAPDDRRAELEQVLQKLREEMVFKQIKFITENEGVEGLFSVENAETMKLAEEVFPEDVVALIRDLALTVAMNPNDELLPNASRPICTQDSKRSLH